MVVLQEERNENEILAGQIRFRPTCPTTETIVSMPGSISQVVTDLICLDQFAPNLARDARAIWVRTICNKNERRRDRRDRNAGKDCEGGKLVYGEVFE